MADIFSKPEYKLARIEHLWAFIGADEDGEGLTAFMNAQGQWMPMVASDERRVESLTQMAESIAKAKEIRLVKFTVREEIRIIGP